MGSQQPGAAGITATKPINAHHTAMVLPRNSNHDTMNTSVMEVDLSKINNLDEAGKVIKSLIERNRSQAQLLLTWRRRIRNQNETIQKLRRDKEESMRHLSSQLLLFESQLRRKQRAVEKLLQERDNVIQQQQRTIDSLNHHHSEGIMVTELKDLDSFNDSDSAVVMEEVDPNSPQSSVSNIDIRISRSVSDVLASTKRLPVNEAHNRRRKLPRENAVLPNGDDSEDDVFYHATLNTPQVMTRRSSSGGTSTRFLRRSEGMLETVYSFEEEVPPHTHSITDSDVSCTSSSVEHTSSLEITESSSNSVNIKSSRFYPRVRKPGEKRLDTKSNTTTAAVKPFLETYGQVLETISSPSNENQPAPLCNQIPSTPAHEQVWNGLQHQFSQMGLQESPSPSGQVVAYNRVLSNHRSVTRPRDIKYKKINKCKSQSLEELRGRLKKWTEVEAISVTKTTSC